MERVEFFFVSLRCRRRRIVDRRRSFFPSRFLSFFPPPNSYIWPPREDRRDDPVLRELEPWRADDAGPLLGRLFADVEAEAVIVSRIELIDFQSVYFFVSSLFFLQIECSGL